MKRHPLDAVSLVFGVLFAAAGVLSLTGIDVGELASRFWPAALIVLGLALVFTARNAAEPRLPEAPRPAGPKE